MRFTRLAVQLTSILLVMTTNAAAERPDRPDFDHLRVAPPSTQDDLELSKYDDATRRLDAYVTCRTVDGDVSVDIRAALSGADKQSYSSNAAKMKQGASLRVRLDYSSPGLSFTKSGIFVESCKASWSVLDKDSNGSFFDAVDLGAFKMSCGSDLPTALALSESETEALVAATGGKYACKGKAVPEVACFRGDTLVATERGAKPIRDLRVGDQVWSWNETTGTKVLSRVSRTFVHEPRGLRLVRTGEETVYTTDEHPFFVEGRGWTNAARLAVGDKLRSQGDAAIAVASNTAADKTAFYAGYDPAQDAGRLSATAEFGLQRASLTTPGSDDAKVYNIEVEGTHNYFVGRSEVLVHNK